MQVEDRTGKDGLITSMVARGPAILSFLSGLFMFVLAWKRRKLNGFHRMMLVMSVYIMIWSACQIIGTAAVPAGTPNTYGAYGNTATCTAQGFFQQWSYSCIMLYYGFLSVYSWFVIVYGNFDPHKYSWVEPYIHALNHLFPIGSAIYLLAIQGYNSTGLRCWVGSIPLGCGDDSGVVCERGPQNISAVVIGTILGPGFFLLAFETVVMIALNIQVWKINKADSKLAVSNRRLFGMTPKRVFLQSVFYLGVIYVICLPIFSLGIMIYIHDYLNFTLSVVGSLTVNLQGALIMLFYCYFSFYSAGVIPKRSNNADTNNNGLSSTEATTGDEEEDTSGSAINKQYSFNIFDGTCIAGSEDSPFSQFVFDGDEEDKENDRKESDLWAAAQSINDSSTTARELRASDVRFSSSGTWTTATAPKEEAAK